MSKVCEFTEKSPKEFMKPMFKDDLETKTRSSYVAQMVSISQLFGLLYIHKKTKYMRMKK